MPPHLPPLPPPPQQEAYVRFPPPSAPQPYPYPQQPYPQGYVQHPPGQQGYPYAQQPYPQQPYPYAQRPYAQRPPAYPSAYGYPVPYGQPWGPPYQAAPPRRGRRVAMLVVVALLLVAGATSDSWLALLHPRPAIDQHAGAVSVAQAQDLPQPQALSGPYPTPGFEEAGAPLGTPPSAPSSTAYAFQDVQPGSSGTELPVAWSPCRPIHVAVNEAGAPPGFVDQVLAAFGELAVATGLAVTYDGLTDEAPDADRALFQPERYGDRWAPVVVEFSDANQVGELAGDVAGLTITHILQSRGRSHIVTAEVYLDSETLRMPDESGYPAYVSVLRHELGHVAGLDHVDDRNQLMYPWTTGIVTYQDGDLAGLARLGQGTCAPSV